MICTLAIYLHHFGRAFLFGSTEQIFDESAETVSNENELVVEIIGNENVKSGVNLPFWFECIIFLHHFHDENANQ